MKVFLRFARDFWFAPVEQRHYSAVRVCYALAAIVNLLALFPHRYSFFGTGGMVIPADFSLNTPSILLLARHPIEVDLLFASAFLVMVSLLLGYCSRVALLLCCVWHVSLHVALGPMSSGFDAVLRLYGFILLISPLSTEQSDGYAAKEKESSPLVPIYGIRLMQLQLCAIYWCTVMPKWGHETWRSGDYLWYFLNSSFSNIPHEYTLEYAGLLQLATWSTLLFESTIPLLLLYGRTRRLGLLMGFMFHGGIALMSSLYLFSVAMLPAYASFFQAADLPKRVADRRTRS